MLARNRPRREVDQEYHLTAIRAYETMDTTAPVARAAYAVYFLYYPEHFVQDHS
jgi:hypothetical protein